MRAAAALIFAATLARADETLPPVEPAPVCHDKQYRLLERAFADYCRGRTGRGVHGSCADWLRAYRRCEGLEFETPARAVLKLFDCHDVVVDWIAEGKRWRVKEITMRSLLPEPSLPHP